MTNESEGLVKSISIENLCARRDTTIQEIETASALLIAANKDLEELEDRIIEEGGFRGYLTLSHLMRPEYQKPSLLKDTGVAELTVLLDAQFWRLLMAASGMQTFMDAQARAEWEEKLNDNKHPPFTRENVRATFRQLNESRGEIFERGVLNVFEGLSRWDYKTNKRHRFGKRLIMEGFVHWGSPDYEACNKLDDLRRVFHLLDGKPEPDHRQGVLRSIREAGKDKSRGEHTFEHFSLRWFKKGTAHLTFLRPDLVDELNRIVAKHRPDALPPA